MEDRFGLAPNRTRSFSQVSSIPGPCTGYGRQEVAELLINAGAKLDALNRDKQSPLDAARVNREVRHWLYRDCPE